MKSGSPFTVPVKVMEIFAHGLGLQAAVQSIETQFEVDVSNMPGKHLEVRIVGKLSVSSNFTPYTIFEANGYNTKTYINLSTLW